MASCDRVGVQDVMQGYDAYSDFPFFALFQGKEVKFVYTDDDADKGRRLLQDNLDVLARNGSTALFTLRFYTDTDRKGAITISTPYSGSFSFKVTQPVTFELNKPGAIMPANNDQFLAFLISERDQLKLQVQELQEENEELKDLLAETDDKDTEPKKDLGIIGMIGEAGNQFPWMQDLIKEGFTILKHKFAKPQAHAGAMAGITLDPNETPDVQVNKAIQHIITFYVNKYGQAEGWKLCAAHLTKLAELTEDEDIYALAIKKLMAL
jgi:regulator of replication initiation timing